MYLASSCALLILLGSVCTAQAQDSATEECKKDHWKCLKDNKCIHITWRCDSDQDCEDNSDEENCTSTTCAADTYQCGDGMQCISTRWLCDGEQDCVNGGDESPSLCANITCATDRYTCSNGQCIPKNWLCDGSDDCSDGGDERGCYKRTCTDDEKNCTTPCENGTTACNDGQCISSTWLCDGDVDCIDGSDEQDCDAIVCTTNQFKCANESLCIDARWRCDGDIDCPGGSDEDNCSSYPPNKLCENTEWQCEVSGECIHKSWLCDGDQDCTDGTDEGKHCGNFTCGKDMFLCDSRCISKSLMCDGNVDCFNGSDEKNCSLSKSETSCFNQTCPDNSHCEQIRHSNNSIETSCVCDQGLQWDAAAGYCKAIDACERRETCSQICVNVDGGYRCECYPGYTIENNTYCRASGKPVMLYYANRYDIRRLTTDTLTMSIMVGETQSSVALDFDYEDGLIFWTDVSLEKIMRAREDQETGKITNILEVVEHDNDEAVTLDGLAVDWLYKHIYWTDAGSDKIKVSDYDGLKRKTLINSGLDEPRAICVDPENGYMYWSDWGSDPKIERSGLDGSGREIIVYGDEYLAWPNGLTIDYVGKRIYWIDSKLQKIGTVDLDGNNKALMDVSGIQRPFSISVFEDTLYWTDWATMSIKAANKITGGNLRTLQIGQYSAMDVKVYHELRQERKFKETATRLCKAAQCEFLCLPSPRYTDTATVTCVCGDEKKLNSDNRTCSLAPVTITTSRESMTSTNSPSIMSSQSVTRENSTWRVSNTSTFTTNSPSIMSSQSVTRETSTWRISNTSTFTTNSPSSVSSKSVISESSPTTSLSPIVTTESIDKIRPSTLPPCQNQSAKATGPLRNALQQSNLENSRLARRRIHLEIKMLKEKRKQIRALFEERLKNERILFEAKLALINHKVESEKMKLSIEEISV